MKEGDLSEGEREEKRNCWFGRTIKNKKQIGLVGKSGEKRPRKYKHSFVQRKKSTFCSFSLFYGACQAREFWLE